MMGIVKHSDCENKFDLIGCCFLIFLEKSKFFLYCEHEISEAALVNNHIELCVVTYFID